MMTLSFCALLGAVLPLGCSSAQEGETPLQKGKGGSGGNKTSSGGTPGYGGASAGGTSNYGGFPSSGGASGGVPSSGGQLSSGGIAGAATAGTSGGGGLPSNMGGRDSIGFGTSFGGFGGFGGSGMGGTGNGIRIDSGGTSFTFSSSGGSTGTGCDSPGLLWRTANKTTFESYPVPNSADCTQFSGCEYQGMFAACSTKRSLDWVKSHNIAAVFPDAGALRLHDLCLRSGLRSIVVTVLDECADRDCSGCCTENQGFENELIELERYTDERFGVGDGQILWADLGPTQGSGCN